MISKFEGDLITRLRKKPVNGKWFKLVQPFFYYSEEGQILVIPAGIDTDFASIPRGLRWLIPRVGDHAMAAVMHDWLCEYKVVPRKEADKLFLEGMRTSEVNWLKRRTMYFGVRAYSIFTFKK
jgi:hypothetical protein